MKKTLTALLATLMAVGALFALLAPRLLGFSATRLGDAVEVATGMGAKLACSARFVSGFDEAQIIEDLASYSPANRLLDLRYDLARKRVTAKLLGMGETSASYRPGLGCALDIGDTGALDRARMAPVNTSGADWPTPDAGSGLQHLQQKADAILARDNAAGLNTRALLVLQDGRLAAESYAPGIGPQTPLLGWSMGKSVTAMLEGRMEMLGLADAGAADLFPQWRGDARREIALEHLLHMSSGLAFDEAYAPGSDATRMLFSAHSAADVAVHSPAAFTPGAHFSYSSGTTNLIARWMRDRLGGTQASLDFLARELLQPLDLAHTVFELDPSGVFVGSSYLYASARDWARLGQLMLDRGQFNGRQLLSEDWVARASAPNHSRNDPRYGYQFWLNGGGSELRYPQLPEDAYFMLGNREQAVMIAPSTNTVVVRLGWTAGDYPTGENFAELLPGT